MIRCLKCLGAGTLAGMGGMRDKCDKCDSIGYIKEEIVETKEGIEVVEKKKAGRPAKIKEE